MWLIGLPAWGNRCIRSTVEIGIPSILAALKVSGADARFIVYTDRLEAFDGCFGGYPHKFKFTPHTASFAEFVNAHREMMREAVPGEFVALLDGDHLVSREIFAACEKRFADGIRLVMADGPRTLSEIHPPAGSDARTINDFVYHHMHPIAKDLVWPSKSSWPSLVYFRDDVSLIVHGFHLHPVAYVAKEGMDFEVSVDGDLVDCFSREETHIVVDPDELAIAEMSPVDKQITSLRRPNTADSIYEWATRTGKAHRWFFRHTIVHRGDASRFDLTPVNDILHRLGEPILWARSA